MRELAYRLQRPFLRELVMDEEMMGLMVDFPGLGSVL